MASRDATINKRVAAVERIKRVLPGIEFNRFAARGGPEFAHAADMESIAEYLETRAGKSPAAQTPNPKG